MIRITDSIALPDSAIAERFVRAAGDRGQNINKDATAVELRFNIQTSSLPPDMQARLIALGGRHVTKAAVLMILSRASRSQAENRVTARARLLALLKRAAKSPRLRRPTRLPASVGEDRLKAKHRQGATKRSRMRPRASVA
jgi:ribosome-associated protein